MLVDRTVLPKIGFRYAFTTAEGRRAAVVAHHDGRRELVLYDRDDPDRARSVLALTEAETRMLAHLLGLPVVVDEVPLLDRDLSAARAARLHAVRIPITEASPGAGRPLEEVAPRTGACVVAVLRDDRTVTAPPADFRLEPGDVVVAVGDTPALESLTGLLVRD